MGTPEAYPDRSGINRYGEEKIQPDFYEDEYGMRHSCAGELDHGIEWSDDPRSESSRERHFIGRGPRNYFRSDETIREEVCEVFLMNPDLDPGEIDVSVNDGVVKLEGNVRVSVDRYLAEDLARDVTGVKEVENNSRGKFDVGDDPGGLIKGLR